jgi:single stranded DNA-binding protein
MANLNRVFLIGRVTKDPELRYTPKGTPTVEIGLAVNRIWSEEGQKREEDRLRRRDLVESHRGDRPTVPAQGQSDIH